MALVRLSTNNISDWDSFHAECKAVFGFPDFYGWTMDAWIDCLSYLRDDEGMSRFLLARDEALHIEVVDSEHFRRRLPEIFEALVDGLNFVNRRYIEVGEAPAISLILA